MSEKELLEVPVRYVNKKYREMKLIKRPTRHQLATDALGVQHFVNMEPEIVQFKNFEYVTNDPEMVAWLDKHPRVTGKGAKMCIEKSAPVNELRNEFVDLVKEFGEQRVLNILKKRKEKLAEEAPKKSKKKSKAG